MSAAAIEANRRNAQRSTGPTTVAGKARSSQNPCKKGTFSMTLTPIPAGRYAEDPEEFVAQVSASIAAHAPRDMVEAQIVEQIVSIFVRLKRNDIIEADLLASSGSVSSSQRAMMATFYKVDPRGDMASVMLGHLSGDKPAEHSYQFEAMCKFIRNTKAGGKVNVGELWTGEREPVDAAEWEQTLDALVAHFWGSREEAATWAADLWAGALVAETDLENALREGAASQALKNSESAARLSTRLTRQLRTLLEILEQLRQRPLPEASSTPSDRGR